MNKRENWDDYFMRIARDVATRATCERRHVGAVLVRDKMVVSTGYNGSLPGLAHCDEDGHLMEEGHCVRTVHAEQNAVYQAAFRGTAVAGATAYVTDFPCWHCFRALAASGVVRIVYGADYRPTERVVTFAAAMRIELVPLAAMKEDGAA